MSPLGLGLANVAMGIGGNVAAVVIEDYMWIGQFNGGTEGELEPTPTTTDFNDIWDLDGTDYMLDSETATADDGYWILDSNSDVEPLDV